MFVEIHLGLLRRQNDHPRVNALTRLLAAVEVVPLATSAAPVIVRGLSVGKVVGILGLHVVEASGLVEVRGLCVQRRSVLAVQLLSQHACTFF
jgi:hypothetical protein